MTPDEYQAFLAKMNAGMGAVTPLTAASGIASAYPEFASRVAGSVRRTAPAGYLGAPAAIAGAIDQARSVSPEMDRLNSAAAAAARSRTEFGDFDARVEKLTPMDVPDAPVQASRPLPDGGAAQPVSLRGAIGSGGGGIGGGLRQAYVDARNRRVGDFDKAREIQGRAGVAKADRMEEMAALQAIDAQQRQRDAQIQGEEDEKAAQRHAAFLDKNIRLADDVSRQQIDPNRLMKSATDGQRIGMAIGSIIGAGLAAKNRTGNMMQEQIDRAIDRDIQAQMEAGANKRAGLSARMNLFQQMLAQTGDRRQAAAMTRNLMYESAKQKLEAEGQRLAVPEALEASNMAQQELTAKQNELRQNIAAEDWQAEQRRAAAAAAARSAAEREQWNRKMELNKLGLEQDKLKIEAMKAQGDSGKEDNAAIAEATKRLGDDDIVKNRELINSLASRVDDKTGEVKGLGKVDMFRSKIADSPYVPAGFLVRPDDQTRIAQQDWERAKLVYQTAVTGSGGSDAQMIAIGKAFRGAGTNAEKANAIKLLQKELQRREGLATAGLNERQKATLGQRLGREGLVDMPGTVKGK